MATNGDPTPIGPKPVVTDEVGPKPVVADEVGPKPVVADEVGPKPVVTDEVQKVFKSFDSNGDGKISVNELGNVLTALGSTVSGDELKRVMVDLDTDNDGFICLDEFNAFWVAGSKDGGAAAELKDAFDLYDQDRNGLISTKELHLVLNRLNMTCTIEDCNRMIKPVDADGDGNVNFEEFKKMMGHNASTNSTTANT